MKADLRIFSAFQGHFLLVQVAHAKRMLLSKLRLEVWDSVGGTDSEFEQIEVAGTCVAHSRGSTPSVYFVLQSKQLLELGSR